MSYPFDVNGDFTDRCLSSYIDINDNECVSPNKLQSKRSYLWENSVNNGIILNNIGLTGMDNGLIRFEKDRITNAEFIDLFENSKYEIEKDDFRLVLNKIDGNNKIFTYGNEIVEENGQKMLKLHGGFYQGVFKCGCDYQTLPTNVGHGLSFEFELKKDGSIIDDDNDYTLNDRYEDNCGIFFYVGARAENKWWKEYSIQDTFERIHNDYFADDYAENSYINDCINCNYFVKEKPFKYIANYDEYFSSEDYLDKKCNCECEGGDTPSPSGGWDYKFTYPEALNTYEQNSKWYNDHGGVWIENEKWTTSKYKSTKPSEDDCKCDDTEPSCDVSQYVEDDYFIKEVEIDVNKEIETKDGHPTNQPNIVQVETDNKFLLFDNTDDGFNVDTWEEGTTLVVETIKASDKENYFLLYNNCKDGLTAKDKRPNNKEYNVLSDLYRNAFALQIKNDGSVGYKYFVQNCDSEQKYSILSEFSYPDTVKEGEWVTIHVKILPLGIKYGKKIIRTAVSQKIRMMIYVNGKLVFVSKELPTFNFKELNDTEDKQESVPFNISLGGGTQGLSDVIYYNYRQLPQYALPLEKEFGGTFIGYIKSFKIYDCPLTFSEIVKNHNFELSISKNKNIYN